MKIINSVVKTHKKPKQKQSSVPPGFTVKFYKTLEDVTSPILPEPIKEIQRDVVPLNECTEARITLVP